MVKLKQWHLLFISAFLDRVADLTKHSKEKSPISSCVVKIVSTQKTA